ncbi:hypothetical protein TTHERM_01310180 (macronuclear) [Tetrahymena thermophila SB210]|uniref:Uncharacterized protein n=1 Tax=Tetrahymena thermophila (strain SB210) TaxID=312017 RepID=Q24F90_TETTS|nr:hypothetical protein TTHERM_01310180 [Tetrahymena thermophila SB210]EAS06434.1 hypothetical protein TTHERM_01310180 [Tetrahymena thermophila SB210]|eukprot:XP_001026679.1 hypothetical protein TTHERM_01310180 [Tetrahymena thermophila SB210]
MLENQNFPCLMHSCESSSALNSSQRISEYTKDSYSNLIQTSFIKLSDNDLFINQTNSLEQYQNDLKSMREKQNLFSAPQKNIQLNQILKLIQKKVKTPRIYSEHFRRKKFRMTSLNTEEVALSDEALLFGNIKIEANYPDINKVDSQNSVDPSSFIHSVVQLTKYPQKKYLELDLNATHSNQHHHFRFIIDYFRKIPNLNFQRLSRNLAEYSKLLQNRILPHIVHVNRLSQESPDFAHEAFLTYSNIEEQIKSKMLNSVKNTQFYKFSLLKLNFQSKQLDLSLQRVSYSLLDLLGISENDIDRVYNCSPQSLINFEINYKGQQRIDNTINQLEAFTKQLHSSPSSVTVLQTIDGIDIQVKVKYEYIYLNDFINEVPSWIHYLDIVGVVMKYEISPIQLQSVNELRKGLDYCVSLKEVGIEKNCSIYNILEDGNRKQFENQMLKEIFIQQFYPEKMTPDNTTESSFSPNYSYTSSNFLPSLKKSRKSKISKKNQI